MALTGVAYKTAQDAVTQETALALDTQNTAITMLESFIEYQKKVILERDNEILRLLAHDPPPVPVPPVDPVPPVPPVDPVPPVTPQDWGPMLQPPTGKIHLGVSLPSGSLASYKKASNNKLPQFGHEYATSPKGLQADLMATEMKGMVEFLNFKPGGLMGPVEYKVILSGGRDAEIRAAAGHLKIYSKSLFLAVLHEPENDALPAKIGAAAVKLADIDYAKAYRYIWDMLWAEGVKNAVPVWNMMGFDAHIPRYDDLWPGDKYVGWAGGDPYGHNGAPTLALLGKKFYDWVQKKSPGKPVMWCEWGYDRLSTSKMTTILSAAGLAAMKKAMPFLLGLIYWNQNLGDPTGKDDYALANFGGTVWADFVNLPDFNHKVPASLAA